MFGTESLIWGKLVNLIGQEGANLAMTLMNTAATIFMAVGLIGGLLMLGIHLAKNLMCDEDERQKMKKSVAVKVYSFIGLLFIGVVWSIVINVGNGIIDPVQAKALYLSLIKI